MAADRQGTSGNRCASQVGKEPKRINVFGWLLAVEFFIGCEKREFLQLSKEGKERNRIGIACYYWIRFDSKDIGEGA
jgi:hypothetical protein